MAYVSTAVPTPEIDIQPGEPFSAFFFLAFGQHTSDMRGRRSKKKSASFDTRLLVFATPAELAAEAVFGGETENDPKKCRRKSRVYAAGGS